MLAPHLSVSPQYLVYYGEIDDRWIFSSLNVRKINLEYSLARREYPLLRHLWSDVSKIYYSLSKNGVHTPTSMWLISLCWRQLYLR